MSGSSGSDLRPASAGEEPSGKKGSWWHARWAKALIAAAVVGVAIVVVFEGRTAAHDISQTLKHISITTLPWLVVAIGAEAVSFYCYAAVQRRLLLAGGARLTRRSMVGLAVASTGLTNLVPGGVAPAGGWLVGQYRRRGVPMPLALWSVLAGGVAATVSVLALLLVGLGVAGLASAPWLVLGAALVVGATAAIVVGAHRVATLDAWVSRHQKLRNRRLTKLVLSHAATASQFRATVRGGTHVYALSLCNWLMDVVVLTCAFLALGMAVPWRGIIFAYAVAQLAGSLTPLPGGIGAVEGGMVGAFALTGTPVGGAFLATIVYRFITSWGVAAVGSVTLGIITKRGAPAPAALEGHAARLASGATQERGGPAAADDADGVGRRRPPRPHRAAR